MNVVLFLFWAQILTNDRAQQQAQEQVQDLKSDQKQGQDLKSDQEQGQDLQQVQDLDNSPK